MIVLDKAFFLPKTKKIFVLLCRCALSCGIMNLVSGNILYNDMDGVIYFQQKHIIPYYNIFFVP